MKVDLVRWFKHFSILFLLSWSALAAVEVGPTVDWQKFQLEAEWSRRVKEVLTSVLPEKSFVLHVQIDLKKKKVSGNYRSNGHFDSAAVPLSMLDMNAPAMMNPEQKMENVFQDISSIRVIVFVDQKTTDSQVDLARRILGDFFDQSGSGIEEITIERAELKSSTQDSGSRFSQWLEHFQLLIGMFALSLALGVIGLGWALLFFSRNRLRDEQGLVAGVLSGDSSAPTLAMRRGRSERNQLLETHGTLGHPVIGHEQFRQFLKKDPAKASRLIREWIYSKDRLGRQTLEFLGGTLELESFHTILSALTSEERSRWRSILAHPEGAQSASWSEVNTYISSSIAQEVLSSRPVLNTEEQMKIFEMSRESWLHLAQKDPTAGTLLARVLPLGEVIQIFDNLNGKQISQIAATALRATSSDIQSAIPEVVEQASAFSEVESDGEFFDRLAEVIQVSSPEVEKSFFQAFSGGNEKSLLRMAQMVVPYEVILDMPVRFLRTRFSKMKVVHLAELIWCRETREREAMLKICGEPGSSLRDSVDLELRAISAQNSRQVVARSKQSELVREFATFMRSQIHADPTARESASLLVQKWVKQQLEGGSRRPVRVEAA